MFLKIHQMRCHSCVQNVSLSLSRKFKVWKENWDFYLGFTNDCLFLAIQAWYYLLAIRYSMINWNKSRLSSNLTFFKMRFNHGFHFTWHFSKVYAAILFMASICEVVLESNASLVMNTAACHTIFWYLKDGENAN